MARVELATADDVGAGSGGLEGPDGPPKLAAVDQGHVPRWRPDIALIGGAFDTILCPDHRDEVQVWRDGGVLRSNVNAFGDPAGVKATLTQGRVRNRVTAVTDQGIAAWPLELPLDEFTLVFHIYPSADLQSNNATVFKHFGGTNQFVRLFTSAGVLTGEIVVDERLFTPAGLENAVRANLTLAVGDLPANTEKTVWMTWKSSVANGLKVGIGNNVKTATSTNSANPAWLKRPMWGDPRISGGFAVGHGTLLGGTFSGMAVEGPHVYRYRRTYDLNEARPKPALTIDAGVAQGTFKRELGGAVGHYTGWDRAETPETPYAAIRDAEIQALADIGCPIVRVAESNERVAVTLSTPSFAGRSITSINTSDLVAHWRRFLDRGISKLTFHVGYCPTAFGGGTGASAEKLPTISGWTRAQSDTLYAEYWSALITDLKTRLTAAGYTLSNHLHAFTFWNEPSNFISDGSTSTQFADTWQAVAQKLSTDHPDIVKLGGVDGIYASNGTNTEEIYQRAVIDRAQSIGHALGALVFHGYSSTNPTVQWEMADALRAYAASKGFDHPGTATGTREFLLGVTEWGQITISDGGSTGQHVLGQEVPQRQDGIHMAAYLHHALHTMYEFGADFATFFRLGRQADYGQEYMMGLLGNGSPPRPWPVFGALELFLKHGGSRVAAASNWPDVRALASKTAGGVITATYSNFRRQHPHLSTPLQFSWAGLPASFSWRRWRLDGRDIADGRPVLAGEGDQDNLPYGLDMAAMSVGCIQITP